MKVRALSFPFLVSRSHSWSCQSSITRKSRRLQPSRLLTSKASNEFVDQTLLKTLLVQKKEAVAKEDYLLAATLKDQIDALQNAKEMIPSTTKGLVMDVEQAIPLHSGDWRFPPMIEVPCQLDGVPQFQKLIKPPDADTLWQWYAELGKMDADPSWAEVWPSASSLAAALVDRSDQLENKDVIELGAGLGISGITASLLGASTVLLMDREPYALHCAMSTAATVAAMSTKSKDDVVQAAVVDWSTPEFRKQYNRSVDIILASDVLYDPETTTSLAQLIAAMLRQPGGQLWLTDPKEERVEGLQNQFLKAMEAEGAEVIVEELPPTPVYASCYSDTDVTAGEIILMMAKFR